jgi:hypothetical protein
MQASAVNPVVQPSNVWKKFTGYGDFRKIAIII